MRKWQGMKWLNLIFHGEKSIDLMLRTENNNINFFFPPEMWIPKKSAKGVEISACLWRVENDNRKSLKGRGSRTAIFFFL